MDKSWVSFFTHGVYMSLTLLCGHPNSLVIGHITGHLSIHPSIFGVHFPVQD